MLVAVGQDCTVRPAHKLRAAVRPFYQTPGQWGGVGTLPVVQGHVTGHVAHGPPAHAYRACRALFPGMPAMPPTLQKASREGTGRVSHDKFCVRASASFLPEHRCAVGQDQSNAKRTTLKDVARSKQAQVREKRTRTQCMQSMRRPPQVDELLEQIRDAHTYCDAVLDEFLRHRRHSSAVKLRRRPSIAMPPIANLPPFEGNGRVLAVGDARRRSSCAVQPPGWAMETHEGSARPVLLARKGPNGLLIACRIKSMFRRHRRGGSVVRRLSSDGQQCGISLADTSTGDPLDANNNADDYYHIPRMRYLPSVGRRTIMAPALDAYKYSHEFNAI